MDSQILKEELLKLEKKLIKDHLATNKATQLRSLAEAKDSAKLKFEIEQLAIHAQAIESQKKSDPDLTQAKQILKELNEPYAEQKKYNSLQARFAALLLSSLTNFEE